MYQKYFQFNKFNETQKEVVFDNKEEHLQNWISRGFLLY